MPDITHIKKDPLRRYLWTPVRDDLARKMVFIGGPRQVGKTTFALSLLRTPPKNETHPACLNWDRDEHRKRLLNGELPSGSEIVLLDEIHKFARWRNLVKGLYDTQKSKLPILVTGSARLDYYRKGGDSLQGRYHYYRLHPISLRELDSSANAQTVRLLLRFGGVSRSRCFRAATRNIAVGCVFFKTSKSTAESIPASAGWPGPLLVAVLKL